MADGSERTTSPTSEPIQGASQADAIPEAVHEVVALYAARPELRFPDVDHQALERLCDDVRGGLDEVAQAQAVLDQARRSQEERRATLWSCARRAFAYAQVYAEGETELSTELARMKLARGSGASSSKKKRGTRKPKASRSATAQQQASELPFEAESSDAEPPAEAAASSVAPRSDAAVEP